MFESRMGYYSIFVIIVLFTVRELFHLEKNFFQPDKNEEEHMEKVVKFVIYGIIVSVYSVFQISKFPVIVNTIYTASQGEIVEYKLTGRHVIPWEYGADDYNITIRNKSNGKNEEYINVSVDEELFVGMDVEIYDYKAWPLGNVLVKANGKTTEYYQKALRKSETERQIAFLSISLHAIFLIVAIARTYVNGGRKKKSKKYYYMGCAVASMYGVLSWVSYFCPDKSITIGNMMGCMLVVYLFIAIAAIRIIHCDDIQENDTEKIEDIKSVGKIEEKYQTHPILNAEEEMTVSETENREVSRIQEPQITNEETSEPKAREPKNIEEDYPICQFTPVSNTFSRKYCIYRYKAERKDWFKMTVTISVLFIGLGSVIALALDGKEVLVIEAGIILWLLFVGWYYWHKKKKCKKFKQAAKDSRPCEICEVKMALGEKHKYIYSNGQEKIVWMEWDMEGKIKDGQPAVIVYIPLADEFYTDKPETIEMIKEKY